MKILHTADIHLDSPLRSLALRSRELQNIVQAATRVTLRKIIDLAIEEKVAALLLAGDVFDSARRSAQTLAFLKTQMERLNAAAIPVYYIKGNHDAVNPLLDIMDWPANVHIFNARGESFLLDKTAPGGRSVRMHGVSFSGRREPESLLDKFPPPAPDSINIGLLHTSLGGAEGHDVYAPCSVAELAAMGYDYWALGHIHKRSVYRQGTSLIVMPGCPQGRDIGEAGAKSVTMLHIGDNGAIREEERIICDIGFFRSALNIEKAEDKTALSEAVTRHLRACRDSLPTDKAIIRLELSGQTPLYWPLIRDYDYWQGIIENYCSTLNNIWAEKLELKLTELPSEREQDAAAKSLPAQEFSALMTEAVREQSFHNSCLKDLQKLVAKLPPNMRAGFGDDKNEREACLASMLAEGRNDILALMETGGAAAENEEDI